MRLCKSSEVFERPPKQSGRSFSIQLPAPLQKWRFTGPGILYTKRQCLIRDVECERKKHTPDSPVEAVVLFPIDQQQDEQAGDRESGYTFKRNEMNSANRIMP